MSTHNMFSWKNEGTCICLNTPLISGMIRDYSCEIKDLHENKSWITSESSA